MAVRTPTAADTGPVPCLESAVDRLALEFEAVPIDRVRAVVFDCYDNLVDSGAPEGALPELVERSARERLREQAF
jgi:hypothetical protein